MEGSLTLVSEGHVVARCSVQVARCTGSAPALEVKMRGVFAPPSRGWDFPAAPHPLICPPRGPPSRRLPEPLPAVGRRNFVSRVRVGPLLICTLESPAGLPAAPMLSQSALAPLLSLRYRFLRLSLPRGGAPPRLVDQSPEPPIDRRITGGWWGVGVAAVGDSWKKTKEKK